LVELVATVREVSDATANDAPPATSAVPSTATTTTRRLVPRNDT
jgi:hypothetical protein